MIDLYGEWRWRGSYVSGRYISSSEREVLSGNGAYQSVVA